MKISACLAQCTALSFILFAGIFLGLGIGLAAVFPLPIAWLGVFFGLGLMLVLGGIYKSKTFTIPALWLTFFLLGALRMMAVNILPANDISHFIGEEGKITGYVRAASMTSDEHLLRYTIDVEHFQNTQYDTAATGRLYVTTKRTANPVHAGDFVAVTGKLKAIHGYQNPGTVDIKNTANLQGIHARMSAGKAGLEIEKPLQSFSLLRLAERVREGYWQAFTHAMGREEAAALFALLFGGYAGVKPALVEAFQTTGLVHILSVSGSHVALLIAFVAGLAHWLSLGKKIILPLVCCTVLFYGLLSGFVPPVIRASATGLLAYFALAMERESNARYLFLLVFSAMLIFEPRYLFDLSFELSFASTAGLLWLTPRFYQKLKKYLPEILAMGFAVTWGAEIMTIPFVLHYFGRISLVAFLANVLVLPAVEALILLALIAGALSFFFAEVAKVFLLFATLLLGFVYESSSLLARIPHSSIYLGPMSPLALCAYGMGLLFFLCDKDWRQKFTRLFPHFEIIILSFIFIAIFLVSFLQKPLLAVHFIDVGQGDAALILTPHKKAVLIDAGGTRASSSDFDLGAFVTLPYLRHAGVTSLEAIYLTHAHEDHAQGAAAPLVALPVDEVITASEGRIAYANSMRLPVTGESIAHLREAEEGEMRTIDGVTFEVLHAPKIEQKASAGGNEVSNVIRVRYGKASFLFTGDLVTAEEAKILQKKTPLASTVLKVGHHGSKTSSSPAFLKAVHPRYAVIEVGADNNFGHPAPEILERLQTQGIEIHRTDKEGAIVFETDGKEMKVTSYVKAR